MLWCSIGRRSNSGDGGITITDAEADLFSQNYQKCASDPRPPHTRQKYKQTSGQNMTPSASKQGKLDSFGAIFLFICLPYMLGWGFRNDSPN